MTDTAASLSARAADLRSAFDHAFAVPAQAKAAVNQDLLAIRAGGEPYAVRLSEIGGLFVDRPVTRIPASSASLLGIAGFRGAIVPVHSLPILLGRATSQSPRWLVMAAAAPIAFAFDLFEGHLRASADAILPQQANVQIRGYAPEFVRSGGIVRAVLNLASIISSFGASDAPANPPQRSEQQ